MTGPKVILLAPTPVGAAEGVVRNVAQPTKCKFCVDVTTSSLNGDYQKSLVQIYQAEAFFILTRQVLSFGEAGEVCLVGSMSCVAVEVSHNQE